MAEQFIFSLVRPPIMSTTRAFNNEAPPAIGFAYISGYLRAKGYTVEIVDGIAEALNSYWDVPQFPGYHCQGLTVEEIIARIDPRTRIIGFAAMFSGEWPITRPIIKAARKKFPDALFVAGGEHITALTEYSLRECPELNVCVRGEGERVMYEICEAWQRGGDFSAIGGGGSTDRGGELRRSAAQPRARDRRHPLAGLAGRLHGEVLGGGKILWRAVGARHAD